MQSPTNPDHTHVEPIPGLAPWIGGKRNLARQIVARIEGVPHTCYAEPFCGMGGVFFRRRQRPTVEAINDRSGEVSNLFRVLQRHSDALCDELAGQLCTRADFDRHMRIDPDLLTDIERAARFAFLQYCAYGGKPAGRTFRASALTAATFAAPRVIRLLRRAAGRLAGVYIDCSDFASFIERYDRPTTLFYLDPPYWGAEGYYGRGLFDRSDFERVANTLRGLSGHFILSINNRSEVREIFAEWQIETVQTTYSLARDRVVTELLISG